MSVEKVNELKKYAVEAYLGGTSINSIVNAIMGRSEVFGVGLSSENEMKVTMVSRKVFVVDFSLIGEPS